MGITKLIYDRTKLSSDKSKAYYKVIYDEIKSGERNKEKIIHAKSLNEADAKFHEMDSDESINVRKKIKLMSKLVYKVKSNKSFSKTGDLFIAIGEALESNNPKSELDKLAKKHGFKKEDLKQAVEAYIAFDDKLSKSADKIMKQLGFSDNITKEFSGGSYYYKVEYSTTDSEVFEVLVKSRYSSSYDVKSEIKNNQHIKDELIGPRNDFDTLSVTTITESDYEDADWSVNTMNLDRF